MYVSFTQSVGITLTLAHESTRLPQSASQLATIPRSAPPRNHAEVQVKEMELTVESLGRRQATGGADEIARIRREVHNIEGALQRRIEEVNTSHGPRAF